MGTPPRVYNHLFKIKLPKFTFSRYKSGVRALYDIYVAQDASDKIDFPVDIADQLRSSLFLQYENGCDPFKNILER